MKMAGRIVKITILVLIFCVASAFIFRFWLGSHYPAPMRRLLPTETLRAAHAAGNLEVKTQEIRIDYEDPEEGLFFAAHMLVAPSTGSLQVTVRYNRSTLAKLEERHGDAFDPEAETPFTYRIFACTDSDETGDELVGTTYSPVATLPDEFAMYRYERLAFEGLSLDGVFWIRLDIYRTGAEEPEGSIYIYENHEKYNEFTDYKIENGELS